MPNSYWLKDGHLIINVTANDSQMKRSRKKRDLLSNYPDITQFHVNDLLLNDVNLSDQGFYQCVIRDGNTQKKSEKIYLQLTGVYWIS